MEQMKNEALCVFEVCACVCLGGEGGVFNFGQDRKKTLIYTISIKEDMKIICNLLKSISKRQAEREMSSLM